MPSPVESASAIPMGTVSLRPEVPEDRLFLYKLYASTRADEMKLVPWDDSQKAAFLWMQFDAQATHYHRYYPNASFEVILLDGQAVGRMYIDRTGDEILLIDIALLPQYRGGGIGGRLLHELLSEAEAQGKPVRIHVERENPAMHLYARLGFQKIEDKGIYYFMEWRPGVQRHASQSAEQMI